MVKKSKETRNVINNILSDVDNNINEKTTKIQEIIRNTILSIKSNKNRYIFSNNDAILSISLLTELYETIKTTHDEYRANQSDSIKTNEKLQKVNEKLMMIICGFGTKYMEDLLNISLNNDIKSLKIDSPVLKAKFELIKRNIQPIGCKIINWKPNKQLKIQTDVICINKISEDTISIEDSNTLECFDTEKTVQSFHQKVFGICVVIHIESSKKTLIINGIVDDLPTECLTNEYIDSRRQDIQFMVENYDPMEKNTILKILDAFSLKDYLVFGNEDLNKKLFCIMAEVNSIKHTKLDNTIKKFLDLDAYYQRNLLISLLIYDGDDEVKYLCYILYDLIYTSNSAENMENNDQKYIFESLPWKLKTYFKDIVKYTAKYTNDIMQKYDIHKITLEQQIYLMKADGVVKEKAISKLKEIKSRSDETGMKAKQYLEGLLRIPFYFYKEEPILKRKKEINKNYIRLLLTLGYLFPQNSDFADSKKEKYSLIEISSKLEKIDAYVLDNVIECIETTINSQTNKQVLNIVNHINTIRKSKKERKLLPLVKNKSNYIRSVIEYLNDNKSNKPVLFDIFDTIHTEIPHSLNRFYNDIGQIKANISQVEASLNSIENVLDESIYSHKHAKNQIMKIIAQWMNGEQTGYCFGFEGCPGVGKTSLAKKGLSNCLKDEEGNSRPFAFIALGGSSNGSMLEGHGYTYMNSTWGRIVDILMETKCMNPIIYIDELDKVSKSETGKEIIGIFTHLIDQTQNDKFQDKYFSGIDIDLSKALFIFSYNDPDQIDKVLLDRIHRIKFDNLTIGDKMVIVKNYLIPEINKKMGFENIVEISDEIVEFIIVNYTMEPGVRKLKEILFDLFGEINLSILKPGDLENCDIPIVITKENLENNYLSKYNKIIEKKIHRQPEIGIINGLWANNLANGGIIPIQTLFFPSSTFLELKLTGLQGDVMKESMNVAKSLAWNLTEPKIKKNWLSVFEETKDHGLHIHCPEGSVSKDGPSAGAAITVAIYSLLNKIPIKNDVALTGEISLNGEITAIGGLDNKIVGGIRSGITTFLYPVANNKQFMEWKNRDNNGINFKNIRFIEVSSITEVFKYVFAPKE
jgi:hypothetical protein